MPLCVIIANTQLRANRRRSPSYVSLTHVVPRANVKSNQRCFLQIVVANESDEVRSRSCRCGADTVKFLSYFPQHKWAFMDASRRYTQFCSELMHLMKADSHKAKTNPEKLKLVARLKEAGTRPELPAIREFLSRIELDDFENLLPPPTQYQSSEHTIMRIDQFFAGKFSRRILGDGSQSHDTTTGSTGIDYCLEDTDRAGSR